MITETRETNRRIRSDILGHTSGISDLSAELVLVNAIGGCGLADMAGSAGEHQPVVDAVFLRVEQVGTVDVSRRFDKNEEIKTYHSRQNRK